MATAIFPGSFNPFTKGHADIAARALGIFDRLVICIGVHPDKPDSARDAEARAEEIRALYHDEPRVKVVCWDGLTAALAEREGARFLIRGIRSVRDFEYERDMADANRHIAGLETVVLFADPALSWISSSLVRELSHYGCDTQAFLPKTSEK